MIGSDVLLGDRAVVLKQAFLRRLVVVRRDREEPLDAERFRVRGELGDLVRVVAADARQDRHASARRLRR